MKKQKAKSLSQERKSAPPPADGRAPMNRTTSEVARQYGIQRSASIEMKKQKAKSISRERKQAREYMEWLMRQRTNEPIDVDVDAREDVTVVAAPRNSSRLFSWAWAHSSTTSSEHSTKFRRYASLFTS